MTRWRITAIVLFAAALAAGVFWKLEQRPWLPYKDHFSQNKVSEWTSYDGVWHLNDGIVTNRSDEGGAKLVTGSSGWTDYQVTADIQIGSSDGDVGIVVRAGHLRKGIDALHGYYATLQSETDALVLGVANDSHLDRMPKRLAGGFHSKTWYRLHVVVVGCEMAAEAINLTTGDATYAALLDDRSSCFRSGKIALRSNHGGGAWKNIHAERASRADLGVLEKESGPPLPGEFPIREDNYARMWDTYFAGHLSPTPEVPSWVHKSERRLDEPPISEIAALRSLALPSPEVRLRGTVTSTNPVYVQDATGGIRIDSAEKSTLNVGDEVESIGHVQLNGNEQALVASGLRLLWDRTPLAPIWITPAQASSGQLDGSLVEVSGTLISSEHLADGTTMLHLENSSQGFTVDLQSDAFNTSSEGWPDGSSLRTHGICTAADDPSSEGAFKLLVASASDIQVLSGPPWWSGWRLVGWIFVVLAVIGAGVSVYIQGERSKLRAVMKERERLAYDMHDTLAQSFAGVAYCLQAVRKSLIEADAPQAQVQDMSLACEMVASTHREASASIAVLHPDMHKDDDLLNMLERVTASMLEGNPLPITMRREGPARRLSPALTDVLVRVGGEAIANVLRHARATQLTLTLTFGLRHVQLRIQDNGVGMCADKTTWGFGLKSMQRRCQSIDASLEVKSETGRGCTVEICAPYSNQRGIASRVRRFFERRIRS